MLPSPTAPGSAAHLLTYMHPSMAFPLPQALHPGTHSFLPLHSGMLLLVLVLGPLVSVLGDILPHFLMHFSSRMPLHVHLILGPLDLAKKKSEKLNSYLNFLCLFCLHQSVNIFPRLFYFAEYKIMTARLVNTKLPSFRLLWCVTVYVISCQNCPTSHHHHTRHITCLVIVPSHLECLAA